MKTLVIDVGGTHVKVLASGKRLPIKIDSGPEMTPRRMVAEIRAATAGWQYDRISIGFPGPVRNNRLLSEPWNLGRGWVGFNFERAFACPVRLINDAAMQALGSYAGGNMLFLGLGTGLGSTMIHRGVLIPLELAHLPYRDGESYEAWLGNAGMEALGKKRWRRHVLAVVDLFMAGLQVDYVVLGGGNARNMRELPKYVRLGNNANAFKGGFRMWDQLAAGPARDGHQPKEVMRAE
jgi:polyphosphate glucokinase